MNRADHLAWCKRRALDEWALGNLTDAVASMVSDLSKHEETGGPAVATLGMLGLHIAMSGDRQGVRNWIEGFN